MRKKKYLDKRNVVTIDEFMLNYLGKSFDDLDELTHRNMCIYLNDKYNINLKRISFKEAKPEKVLTGEYVLVKDEAHQVKIYVNPMRSLDMLQAELNTNKIKEEIKKKRKTILNSLGLVETNSEVLSKKLTEKEEYNIEKPNRQKQFVISNHSYYRKRHY